MRAPRPGVGFWVLLFAGIVALVWVSYRSIFAGWFLRDDFMWLYDAQQQWADPRTFLTWRASGYLRPIPNLFFGLEYALFGRDPWGYYLANLLLHSWNCIWLAVLSYTLYGSRRAAAITGLLFACLSTISDCAYWISNITTLNAAAAMLPALVFQVRFCREGRRRDYLATLVLTAVCVLSKETAVSLGPLLILIELRERGWRSFLRGGTWARYAPFVVMAGLYVVAQTGHIQTGARKPQDPVDLAVTWLLGSTANFTLQLVPRSTLDAVETHRLLYHPLTGLAVAAGTIAVLWLAGGRARAKQGLGLLLATLVVFAPFAIYIARNHPVRGRYLYLPSLAPAILAGLLVAAIMVRPRGRARHVLTAVCTLLVAGLLGWHAHETSESNHILARSRPMKLLVEELEQELTPAWRELAGTGTRWAFVGLPIENHRHLQCLGSVFLDLPFDAFEAEQYDPRPRVEKDLVLRNNGAWIYETHRADRLLAFYPRLGLAEHDRTSQRQEALWKAFSRNPRDAGLPATQVWVQVLEF